MPTDFIVTLVHGTFARGAPWTMEGSLLFDKLKSEFEERIMLQRIDWSGENSIFGRRDDALLVADEVERVHKANPERPHFLIAHSHGGNVVLYALDEYDVGRWVAGVCTLATPFFHAKPRDLRWFRDNDFRKGAGILAGLPVLIVSSLAGASPLTLVVVTSALSVLGGLASEPIIERINACRAQAERLAAQIHARVTLGMNLRILRVTGDEASFGLVSGQALAWASTRILRDLTAPTQRLSFRNPLRRWRRLLAGILCYLTTISVGSTMVSIEIDPGQYNAVFRLVDLIGTILIISAVSNLLKWHVVSMSLLILMLGMRANSATLGTSPGFMAGGPIRRRIIAAVNAFVLDIHTEAVPSGTWKLTQFEQIDNEKGLHSELVHSTYNDQRAVDAIIEWIKSSLEKIELQPDLFDNSTSHSQYIKNSDSV